MVSTSLPKPRQLNSMFKMGEPMVGAMCFLSSLHKVQLVGEAGLGCGGMLGTLSVGVVWELGHTWHGGGNWEAHSSTPHAWEAGWGPRRRSAPLDPPMWY